METYMRGGHMSIRTTLAETGDVGCYVSVCEQGSHFFMLFLDGCVFKQPGSMCEFCLWATQ